MTAITLTPKMLTPRTLTRGEQTRERILEIAEAQILRCGFVATTTDDIISAAGLTRSGFVYHFPDKHHLAKALLQRYVDHDTALMDQLFARADALVDDPLHSFLAYLKMLSEVMADLPGRHPGCLVASYCYQEQVFSAEIRALSTESMLMWRRRFRERLDRIAAKYPPRVDINLDALADMMIVLVEGGIILDKANGDGLVLAKQMMMARTFVKLVFDPS